MMGKNRMSKDWIYHVTEDNETSLEEDYPEETVLEFKVDIPEVGLIGEICKLILPGFEGFRDRNGKVQYVALKDDDLMTLKIYVMKDVAGAVERARKMKLMAIHKGYKIIEMDDDVNSMIDTAKLNLRMEVKMGKKIKR